MPSIDLIILGMVMEKPQSAYEIQKDVEYHQFSRWTKISVPSIYRKVLQLEEKGWLRKDVVKGERLAPKAVYSITSEGRARFRRLMEEHAAQPVSLTFDFNVVISNLNKLEKPEALALLQKLRENIEQGRKSTERYAAEYDQLPLVGKTIFDQQRLLYDALSKWLDGFSRQLVGAPHGP